MGTGVLARGLGLSSVWGVDLNQGSGSDSTSISYIFAEEPNPSSKVKKASKVLD